MAWLRLLRVRSKMREAPSITCIRSSHMEPVTSKTKARVASPVVGGSTVPGAPVTTAAAETATNSCRSGARGIMLGATDWFATAVTGRSERGHPGEPEAAQSAAAAQRLALGAHGTGARGGVPLLGAGGGP